MVVRAAVAPGVVLAAICGVAPLVFISRVCEDGSMRLCLQCTALTSDKIMGLEVLW